jgi:uncharacterized protein (TIGR02217 family)
MAFHEVRFPDNISRGARGGPQRRTQIVELASGREERNASWADSRRRYDVSYGIRRADDLHAVVEFFEARLGRLYGFRFKDWADYKSGLPSRAPDARDQLLGTGDGSQRHFRLRKWYGTDALGWWRAIRKPVAGTVRVALSEVEQFSGWSVDAATGILSFETAPDVGAAVCAGFEFDVPVRFDSDLMDVTLDIERLGSITSIPLIELRKPDAPFPIS